MNYKKTVHACFFSYVVQAIIVNFAPLLFLTFNKSFGIPLSKITLLITVNFMLQLVIDLCAVKFVEKLGYRICAIAANIFSFIGLIAMAFLPFVMDPFAGLIISVLLYAVGGGLIEVVISPIVEACPTDNKATVMSLLHSFYAWGSAAVILLSTAFFAVFGTEKWQILALLWSIVPVIAAIMFIKVPITTLEDQGHGHSGIKELISKPLLWLLILLMMCAGACEQAVAQWASTLTEQGLGVSKTVGDIAGPAMFAICMGISRTFYGKKGENIDLKKFMILSGILCIISYLCISLSPYPVIGLIGCALCGLAVGIMWPGTLSIASSNMKGGSAMFAFLALGGDLGCSLGPTYTGLISSSLGDNLQAGVLAAIIFPLILVGGIYYLKKKTAK